MLFYWVFPTFCPLHDCLKRVGVKKNIFQHFHTQPSRYSPSNGPITVGYGYGQIPERGRAIAWAVSGRPSVKMLENIFYYPHPAQAVMEWAESGENTVKLLSESALNKTLRCSDKICYGTRQILDVGQDQDQMDRIWSKH